MKVQSQLPMVNLGRQYDRLKKEIDIAIATVLSHNHFIDGPEVVFFADELANYLGASDVVPCGNGTDALQIALMSLDMPRGAEILVPSFTYAASAEVIKLLGYVPRFCDVDKRNFNLLPSSLEERYTDNCKAIIAVHLFGQPAPMHEILSFAQLKGLFVIEDNAQALGARYRFPDGTECYTGTMGHIGCTSFFPSKNLGAYGDGGALIFGHTFSESKVLAKKARTIAHHGQSRKYIHDIVGCNSRLDTIQAAILRVKLRYLDEFNKHRREVANFYSTSLEGIKEVIRPTQETYAYHIFHQYTIRIPKACQSLLADHFKRLHFPFCIYFPLSLHKQKAYITQLLLPNSEELSTEVFSLPICSEITESECGTIVDAIEDFFENYAGT